MKVADNKNIKENFTFSFETPMSPEKVFGILLDVRQWWSGIYGETITGKSREINDVFNFKAAEGAHITEQRLTELKPNKSVEWQVIKSNLSFLSDPGEWKDTRFRFDLVETGKGTQVTFTHIGLIPEIECYESCTSGWTGYLTQLKNKLN